MKKFLSLLCMIACVFGLTACGSEGELTAYEQDKVDSAIALATEYVIPSFDAFKTEEATAMLAEYTAEEVAYLVEENVGIAVEGYAYKTAVTSFNDGYETIGDRISIGESSAVIDDDQIIVHVAIEGAKESAQAEVIFSNDMFLKMESAALNPVETMGDLMINAALNTLIGMGTVFAVLILISGIISAFALIPKMQAMFSKKNKKEETKATGSDKATAPAAVVETVVEETDDLELIAVIAAAIAASEGAASTDGFVVRSIRRRR